MSYLTDPLGDFWSDQGNWSQDTFGTDKERGPKGPLLHLQKEVIEALENPTDIMEYVDCFFLIIDAVRRAGFGYWEFVHAFQEKLEINKKRKWNRSNDDTPSEHVRE